MIRNCGSLTPVSGTTVGSDTEECDHDFQDSETT